MTINHVIQWDTSLFADGETKAPKQLRKPPTGMMTGIRLVTHQQIGTFQVILFNSNGLQEPPLELEAKTDSCLPIAASYQEFWPSLCKKHYQVSYPIFQASVALYLYKKSVSTWSTKEGSCSVFQETWEPYNEQSSSAQKANLSLHSYHSSGLMQV